MNERVEALKSILELDGGNALARYGLAMEYVKAGYLEEAVAEFRALVSSHPEHVYGYFHGGQTLEKLGRTDEARQIYSDGIAAANRAGDKHGRSELQSALDLLG